jgi:hypothetical protein
MKYPKGTVFESYDEPYTVVGTVYIVNDSYVLVPQDEEDTDVILYTEAEIEEGLEEGWLVIKK